MTVFLPVAAVVIERGDFVQKRAHLVDRRSKCVVGSLFVSGFNSPLCLIDVLSCVLEFTTNDCSSLPGRLDVFLNLQLINILSWSDKF